MSVADLEDPPPDEARPRRPAGLPRSNTFGEVSPHAVQQEPDASLRHEEAQQDVALGWQEIDANAGMIFAILVSLSTLTPMIITGFYACASPHRRFSSNYDSDTTTDTIFDHDAEMKARAGAPGQEQQQPKGDGQREAAHMEAERCSLGEHTTQHDEEGEEGKEGGGDTIAVETGTARVAQLVTPGTISMVDIRRRDPRPLKSSRSVRDVSSLPDLAWAQSLTTGGGRSAASVDAVKPVKSVEFVDPSQVPTKSNGAAAATKMPPKKKGLRKLVTKRTVREWCERGMGAGPGGFGPYAGMC